MIQVDIAPDPLKHSTDRGYLILNGHLIEDSDAGLSHGRVIATVYDMKAVALLLACRLAEVTNYFEYLTLQLLEPLDDNCKWVDISCSDNKNAEPRKCNFTFQYVLRPEHWTKPWSIADFASTLEKLLEDRGVPGLSYHESYESQFYDIFLKVELYAHEETVEQILEDWLPIVKGILEETEALLTANIHKGALVALFRFAPEVKTACEQYLLYFVQFLEDLGISATADLQEQARSVLFAVTPESGPEALEQIREALDVYLRMPQSPDFDREVTRHSDIAVQQYAANVYHLRSQLALAQAVLETKNATIEALQATNLQYKQLLSANSQSQGQLASSRTDDTQKDETILGGTVTLTKYTWKGVQFNLPFIFRELRRRFKGRS